MRPTFMGLETAKRAMQTQQSALHTLGNNVANANTSGYSRQRVNMATTASFPGTGFYAPNITGQIGTGVEGTNVTRIREPFLDIQFRKENNRLSYYSTRYDGLDKMQEIMNEPTEQGLAKTMDRFWQSLQDLSTNPQDSGTRTVVIERAKAVAETLNYLSGNLKAFQTDMGDQLNHSMDEVNTLLNQIHQINNQIKDVEPHGYIPNDLYDKRDVLLDQLSQHIEIKVSYEPSGGNASASAEGIAHVTFPGKNGNYITLIDGTDVARPPAQFDKPTYAADGTVQSITLVNSVGSQIAIDAKDFSANGSVKSLIDTIGYVGQPATNFSYSSMLAELDKVAADFAEAFNTVHKNGVDLNGDLGVDFFASKDGSPITASNIIVAITDPNKVAAAAQPTPPATYNKGDGSNALELGKVFDNCITDGAGNKISFTNYYQSIIGKMGVQAQEAKRMTENSQTLTLSVENRRQSISAVSLDEEMSSMIMYQHAYNAAARNVTLVDEMLDKIINGMGLAGR